MRTYKWLIPNDEGTLSIEYTGMTPTGEAKVEIDGLHQTFMLTPDAESHYMTRLPCGSRECILQMDLQGESVLLRVDGEAWFEAQDGSDAMQTDVGPDMTAWARKEKSGMSSFLSLVVLSLLNVVLLLINAPISFPFSVFASSVAVGVGAAITEETGSNLPMILGLVAAFLSIGAYAVLYLLARKHEWPVWLAFGLMVFDTLILAFFALTSEDMVSLLIDAAFHLWILWSLLNLGLARRRIARFLRTLPVREPEVTTA